MNSNNSVAVQNGQSDATISIKATGNNFRNQIREQLMFNAKKFWENMSKLPPKDYCDVFIKMLPYGFSKVPEERPIGEDENKRLILEETTRKATIISRGLPEDNTTDYKVE